MAKFNDVAKSVRLVGRLEECFPEVVMPHESTPAVYLLVREDRVVYVGESQDVLVRLLQHCGRASGGSPCHPFDRAFFVPASADARERRRLEGEFIRVFRPTLNRRGPLDVVFQEGVIRKIRLSAAEVMLAARRARDHVRKVFVDI